MADTSNEGMQEAAKQEAAKLAAAARDRGIEHLEGAKGQLADGAERVAAAVERTADELDGEGDGAISGFGHSVASLMRQLAGGLRERDVEAFAQELGSLARRNPGVFLAGSVALGFGIARFFKARGPQAQSSYGDDRQSQGGWRGAGIESGRDQWQSQGGWQGAGIDPGGRRDVYSEEDLDFSAGATQRDDMSRSQSQKPQSGSASSSETAQGSDSASGTTTDASAAADEDRKSRQSAKPKVKTQRASSSGDTSSPPANERPSTDPSPSGGTDSAFTGGKGGGALRGGKS